MTAATLERSTADEARRLRYGRRWHSRRFSTIKRVSGCGRWQHGSGDGQVVVKQTPDGRCFYSGLQSCGSVWACPVCQAKIGQRRAVELSEGMDRWMRLGNTAHFVTFTLPHDRATPLRQSFESVAAAWRKSLTGREWRSIRRTFGIAGYVRTIEATFGQANGWHPHIHAVFFTNDQLTDDAREALYALLFNRWRRAVQMVAGITPLSSAFHAEEVANGTNLGRYMVKLGLELHRHDLKQGKRSGRYTPWEILDVAAAATNGETWAIDQGWALARWQEWETVTKGRRCMTWANGTRALLELGQEKTDEEIAAEEVPGEIVLVIDPDTWHLVARRKHADVIALEHAEADGAAGLLRWLRKIRLLT